jgi:adenylylsulfate kinase-like enzyme
VAVITAAISPYRETRDAVRRQVESDGVAFIEAYVAATLEECEARDVKGLYAEARAGRRPGFTGIDDPYEPPLHPELVLPTGSEAAASSVARVLAYLESRGIIPSASGVGGRS